MDLTAIVKRYRAEFEQAYATRITSAQRHAIDAMLINCRSGRYGHMQLDCQHCHWQCTCNHSCGHRFCHRCQHHDTATWLDRQARKLLPVNYFMVTFTLPAQLRGLAWYHQSAVFSAMFHCASGTLSDFVKNDKKLNAKSGLSAVLHTHSRRLDFHLHVHVIVPAGGFNTTRHCWVRKKANTCLKKRRWPAYSKPGCVTRFATPVLHCQRTCPTSGSLTANTSARICLR